MLLNCLSDLEKINQSRVLFIRLIKLCSLFSCEKPAAVPFLFIQYTKINDREYLLVDCSATALSAKMCKFAV